MAGVPQLACCGSPDSRQRSGAQVDDKLLLYGLRVGSPEQCSVPGPGGGLTRWPQGQRFKSRLEQLLHSERQGARKHRCTETAVVSAPFTISITGIPLRAALETCSARRMLQAHASRQGLPAWRGIIAPGVPNM